jgi:ribose transport system substrate-binding protein
MSNMSRRADMAVSSRTRRRRLSFAVLAATTAITLFAGCAATSSGASEGATTSIHALTDSAIAEQGTAAGNKAGHAKLQPHKVGFVEYSSDPTSAALYAALTQSAKLLGWTASECDGQGVPATINDCVSTFVTEHVSAILSDGIPQTVMASGLSAAQAAGIETIDISAFLQPSNLFSVSYYPSDAKLGALLASYVKSKLQSVRGPKQIIAQGFTAPWSSLRLGPLTTSVKGTNMSIVAHPEADATNLVQGTETQIAALLTQYPNTKAVWITFDTAVTGAAQAISAKYPGKQFPQRPLLVSFYAQAPFLQLIREGQLDALAAGSIAWTSWVAMDQLAEHFGHNVPLSKNPEPYYGPGLDFWRAELVTKANLPPAGASDITPPVNYAAYFTAKWKAEFGSSH